MTVDRGQVVREVEAMPLEQVVTELRRRNPFGGYTTSDRPVWLRASLVSWRLREERGE